MHDIIESLFKTRNLFSQAEKDAFLNPNFDTHVHDGMLLSDMDKAITRIKLAIDNREMIGIYTDYDCDGIPGAVILSDFLKKIGHTNFVVYIPDRQIDGYGLSRKGIDFLFEKKATLIITIDLGITGHESTLYASSLGVDSIITDHHLPQETLPSAYAIINPKKEGDHYPYKDLCGTGVIYKVICSFLNEYRNEYNIAQGFEKWLLDMVALATLGDMVPLTDENRVFTYYGLMVLKKTKRPGLQKLFSLNYMRPEFLTEDDVTFTIVPRINATSRMGSAYLAYDMLTAKDEKTAHLLAQEIETLNKRRKALVLSIMKEIHRFDQSQFEDEVIVLGDPKWRPGVLGLVATKLVETYKKPVFVWGGSDEEDSDILKGSCRGPEGVSIVEIMQGTKDTFIHFGGHHGAGGFSLDSRQVHCLKNDLLNSYRKKITTHNTIEKKNETQKGELGEYSHQFYTLIRKFAPFGIGNEKPLIEFPSCTLVSFKQFGKGEEHLEAIFLYNDKHIKAISFFKSPKDFTRMFTVHGTYTVFGYLEVSYFGKPELRLRIVDII